MASNPWSGSSVDARLGPPQLRLDRRVTLVLGGGAVRGMTHLGVLEVLAASGLQVREMIGTSIGALVVAFYAAVGMDVQSLIAAGLALKSRHLLCWALLRHAPTSLLRRWARFAGVIPELISDLAQSSYAPLHHGVEKIGIVAYDALRREEIVCHSEAPQLRLEDAVRGSAALPGVFPAWRCNVAGHEYRLQDGGVVNCLPAEVAFSPPFCAEQVLAVDVSSRAADRERNVRKIEALRRKYEGVPIDLLCADTLGGSSVVYASGYLPRLLEAGRRSARTYLAEAAKSVDSNALPRSKPAS